MYHPLGTDIQAADKSFGKESRVHVDADLKEENPTLLSSLRQPPNGERSLRDYKRLAYRIYVQYIRLLISLLLSDKYKGFPAVGTHTQ